MTKIHRISTAHLSVDKLQDIIENGYKLELSDESKALILKCRNYLDNKLKNKPSLCQCRKAWWLSRCRPQRRNSVRKRFWT